MANTEIRIICINNIELFAACCTALCLIILHVLKFLVYEPAAVHTTLLCTNWHVYGYGDKVSDGDDDDFR